VRSGLTVVGLAVGVAAVVALVGVAESLETSFLDLYNQRGVDLVVQRRGGGANQLAKGIDLAVGDRIRKIPGVREVVAGLMDMISFEEQDLFVVLAYGWEPNSPVLQRVKVLSGRRFHAGEKHAVMLGRILAANLGKHAGDQVQVYGQDFEVVGVFESFSVYENGAVFLPIDEMQRQMDRPGEVTGYVVKSFTRDADTVAEIRREIESLDPEIAATPCGDFVASLSQLRIARTASWFTSAFAIVIGAAGVMNTLAMAIFERRGEIASLRAMGWRKSRVVRLLLTESLYLATFAAIIGVALGMVGIVLLSHWRRTSGLVQGNFSTQAIVEGMVVALGIALVGTIYPAYRCIKQPIAEALRAR
jgi:putative ABC transport system permease protein